MDRLSFRNFPKLLPASHTRKKERIIALTRPMLTKVWQVDYACGWNLYTMKFMGIWPEERRFDRISSYKVLIGIAFVGLFCTVPQLIQLFLVRDDFNLVMENLSVDTMNSIIALTKMIFFWFNGGQVKGLLTMMEQDWKEVTTQEDEKYMKKLATISRILSSGATAICSTVIIIYLLTLYQTMRTEGRLLLVDSFFPYDAKASPKYEFTCVCQLIGAFYYTITYTAVDTFIAMLLLHICGQLSRLKNELIHLNSTTEKEFRIELARIIKRHDHLNRFIDTIDDRFNIMFLIQILGCTLQLCIECLQILLISTGVDEEMPLMEILFFAFYLAYVLLQLYLYCYIGEKLWFESSDVAQAAYESKWYDLLPNEARTLTLIIRRAQSPMRITAGRFCTFNNELYSGVLKTSMSYLSVLRATMAKG